MVTWCVPGYEGGKKLRRSHTTVSVIELREAVGIVAQSENPLVLERPPNSRGNCHICTSYIELE